MAKKKLLILVTVIIFLLLAGSFIFRRIVHHKLDSVNLCEPWSRTEGCTDLHGSDNELRSIIYSNLIEVDAREVKSFIEKTHPDPGVVILEYGIALNSPKTWDITVPTKKDREIKEAIRKKGFCTDNAKCAP